jgi:glutathione S-transferase
MFRSLTSLQNVTLADLQHLPYGTTLFFGGLGHVIEKRPNVARYGSCELVHAISVDLVFDSRWWKDIYNRPTWQAVKDGA